MTERTAVSTEHSALPPEVATALQRLEYLVEKFEQHPEPTVRERAFELLQCVDTIHRPGLRRLADLLRQGGLQQEAAKDPLARLLLDLYDIGEGGAQERVDAVLEAVRPYVESAGGELELLEVGEDAVRVRVSGAAGGCGGSLAPAVEQLLREGLPDLERVEVLDPAPAPARNFIPLASLKLAPALVWRTVLRAETVPAGEVRGALLGAISVLVARLGDGELRAYHNVCPRGPLPLHGGQVEDGVLACPWHHCRFDLRTGRRLDGDGPGLEALPHRVEEGDVRIGVRDRVTA